MPTALSCSALDIHPHRALLLARASRRDVPHQGPRACRHAGINQWGLHGHVAELASGAGAPAVALRAGAAHIALPRSAGHERTRSHLPRPGAGAWCIKAARSMVHQGSTGSWCIKAARSMVHQGSTVSRQHGARNSQTIPLHTCTRTHGLTHMFTQVVGTEPGQDTES